jgi:hypothetical protein
MSRRCSTEPYGEFVADASPFILHTYAALAEKGRAHPPGASANEGAGHTAGPSAKAHAINRAAAEPSWRTCCRLRDQSRPPASPSLRTCHRAERPWCAHRARRCVAQQHGAQPAAADGRRRASRHHPFGQVIATSALEVGAIGDGEREHAPHGSRPGAVGSVERWRHAATLR